MSQSLPDQTTEKKHSKKIPTGIVVVLIFIGIELLMLGRLLTSGYILPIAHIVLSNTVVKLYLLLSVALLISILVGIIKRFSWARILAISWYGYNAILATINYVTFQMSPDTLISLYQQFKPAGAASITPAFVSNLLLVTMIFIWITGGLISYYLYRKKSYFTK